MARSDWQSILRPCGDPAELAAAIRSALAAVPPRRIHPVLGGTPSPRRRPNSGIPRITMVLSGERHIRWPELKEVRNHVLGPGELILVTPDGWSEPCARTPNRYLCIDCYPDFTRFHLESVSADPGLAERAAFLSDGPLNPAQSGLLQALLHLAARRDDRRMLPIMHCFLDAVLDACRPQGRVPAGLAAWQAAAVWMSEHPVADLGRDRIAAAVAVHPNHLSRLCRRFAGRNLGELIAHVRMERARRLLVDTGCPVAEVARLSGYNDETHFRKRFKALNGSTPGVWRRQAGGPG